MGFPEDLPTPSSVDIDKEVAVVAQLPDHEFAQAQQRVRRKIDMVVLPLVSCPHLCLVHEKPAKITHHNTPSSTDVCRLLRAIYR